MDGVQSGELDALEGLLSMSAIDASLVENMMAYPWLEDDVTEAESFAIEALADIAVDDAELAERVATLEWFVDGVDGSRRRYS